MFKKKSLSAIVRTALVALAVLANAAAILPLGGCASSSAKTQVTEKRSDADQTELVGDKQTAPAAKHGPKHH